METVLIDTFRVPGGARDAFFERARRTQDFVKTLPGFVEGFIYEQRDDGQQQRYIVTIAVWESEEAFENARRAVAEENQQQGINLHNVTTQLGIEATRALYDRTRY
jgi:heme-degrading monooxygenase HmoA